MRFTRRKVVRDLGTLGAISSLPSLLPVLAGCKAKQPAELTPNKQAAQAKRPTSGKPNTLRILLEGPWIISRPSPTSTFLQATAAADSSHKCFCGVWDDALKQMVDPVTGVGPALQCSGPQTWNGKIQNANANSQFKVTLDALKQSRAYVQDGAVTPVKTTDIVLTLPFPDYFLLGGKYLTGRAPHTGRPDFVPHTTAVLGYSQSAGKALNLTFPDPGSPLTNINLAGGNDIVFRMAHMAIMPSPAADAQHVIKMFSESMNRISPKPNRTLALTNVCNDMNTIDSGPPIGPLELGLPASSPSACQVVPAGEMHVMSATFANCVGGIMGVGP